MANVKPRRSDREIEQAAAEWRRRYSPGQPIMLYLRLHLDVFAGLQAAGWSWSDIARSLNGGGVTYATGREWSGDLISKKVSLAREQAKRRASAGMIVPAPTDDAFRLVKRAVVEALEATLDGKGSGRPTQLQRDVEAALRGEHPEQVRSDFVGTAEPKGTTAAPSPQPEQPSPARIIGLRQQHSQAEAGQGTGHVGTMQAEEQDRVDAVLARKAARRTGGDGS